MSTTVFSEAATESPARSVPYALVAFWGGTLFLSAFLLFQVQPILTKLILPWFGGAAAVWTTALMFFQMAYLLGNAYAYWLAGLAVRTQWRVHAALLAASLFLLPIIPRASWKPLASENPAAHIFAVLAATIGLPFVILSATSPLLQSWYARARHGGRPYRFYALSNLGSLLALFSYPVWVEPYFTTRHQAGFWSAAYAVFAICCGAIAFRSRSKAAEPYGSPTREQEKPRDAQRPSRALQLFWVALAADAAALLLAVTNQLSQNVAAVPLLWIVPLSLYLLSLIVCFEGHGWYHRSFFLRLLAVALGGTAYALSPDFANAGPVLQVPLYCAGLFVCCMVCHGELEKIKPQPEYLTLFYLMVSLGGALGGIFVGAIAPVVFNGFYELPLSLGACAVLTVMALCRDPETAPRRGGSPVVFFAALCVAAVVLVSLYWVTFREIQPARVLARNFYGILRVRDLPATNVVPFRRELTNGTIIHGVEILEAGRLTQPTTYFGPESGAGMALLAAQKRGAVNAGIVGLGAGTLVGYGRRGDHFTFYEINPRVTNIAETQFAFLRQSQADLQIVPGDARLSLEREPPRDYDVLLVDAFSGDSIPVHLLTREAFELYLRHLRPGGVLAIHISNKYLDLRPVVEAGARALGLAATGVINTADEPAVILTANWMLLARDAKDLPVKVSTPAWTRDAPKILPAWTDDYSNLLKILR